MKFFVYLQQCICVKFVLVALDCIGTGWLSSHLQLGRTRGCGSILGLGGASAVDRLPWDKQPDLCLVLMLETATITFSPSSSQLDHISQSPSSSVGPWLSSQPMGGGKWQYDFQASATSRLNGHLCYFLVSISFSWNEAGCEQLASVPQFDL